MPSTTELWRAFHLLIVTGFPLHPATKILLWLGCALVIQRSDFTFLALASLIPLLWLARAGALRAALAMLRRARWLLLSLLSIYAFATPGDLALPLLGAFSPSLQGLRGGGMQAWRLALMLVALALLLHSCPQQSLLSGLYVLLRPFRVVGLNPERIAVRLWLTLHYAQQQSQHKRPAWREELRAALDPDSAPDVALHVALEMPEFSWRDGTTLALAIILFGVVLW